MVKEVYLNGGGAVSNTGAAALIKGRQRRGVVGGAGLVTNSGTISGKLGDGIALGAGGAARTRGPPPDPGATTAFS